MTPLPPPRGDVVYGCSLSNICLNFPRISVTGKRKLKDSQLVADWNENDQNSSEYIQYNIKLSPIYILFIKRFVEHSNG